VINSTNINKTTLILTELTIQRKATTCDIENPDPGLEQAQKCGGVKPVMESYPCPLDNSNNIANPCKSFTVINPQKADTSNTYP